MDTAFPALIFDEKSQCEACKRAFDLQDQYIVEGANGQKKLHAMAERLKSIGKGREYDAMIGLSGGIDSAYLAHLVRREMGLRVLAVHVDAGWNSVQAVRNIARIVRKLELDLYTHVVEWQDMRDLQISFMKANVYNQDIPQDHVFFSQLFRTAHKFNIKYFLSGVNFASENMSPPGSGISYMDARHIRAIHAQYGMAPFRQFCPMSLIEFLFYTRVRCQPVSLKPLDLIDYDTGKARDLLTAEYDWEDYGPKHSESRWTKFYQEIFLPKKFGIDKRRIHLSSMIVSGLITRDDALEQLKLPAVSSEDAERQIKFVAKKLGMDKGELISMIEAPGVDHLDYPNQKVVFDVMLEIKRKITKIKRR